MSNLVAQLRDQLDGFDSYDNVGGMRKKLRRGGSSMRGKRVGIFGGRAKSKRSSMGRMSMGAALGSPSRAPKRIALGGGAGAEAAIFDIVVSRNTATLAGTELPFALFGSQHVDSQYDGIIATVNGATLTVANGIIGAAGNTTQFSYNIGANTDVVTIECTSGTTYPSFLRALDAGSFRINKIRMQLSDNSQLTQFAQEFAFFDYSMFGKQVKNKLSVSSFKDPNQFQSGIVDIPFSGEIDNESGFASKLIAVAGFSVTYSVFVEKIA